MLDVIRILGHLFRGRVRLWLCYTNVTWRTCEECLAWHGRIVANPNAYPTHEGCARQFLPFPVWKFGEHRERGRRMAERARAEVARRELFREALEKLPSSPEESLRLFDQAGAVDVYIPELERLAREHGSSLTDPEFRARLRETFLRRWRGKFAKERYERQPELARTAQEAWGVAQIKELFP